MRPPPVRVRENQVLQPELRRNEGPRIFLQGKPMPVLPSEADVGDRHLDRGPPVEGGPSPPPGLHAAQGAAAALLPPPRGAE